MEYFLTCYSRETLDHLESSSPALVDAYLAERKTNAINGGTECNIKRDEANDRTVGDTELEVKTEKYPEEATKGSDTDSFIKTDNGDHVKKKNKRKLSFRCDICGKVFNSKGNLKVHTFRIHSDERPYPCSFCNKSFKTNFDLTNHERIHSKDDKPYKCTKCSRSFHSRFALTEHDFSHTGVSKHCCSQCGTYFSSNQAMQKHKTNIHASPQTKKSKRSGGACHLKCEKCGQLFKKGNEYEDHCNFHCYYKALEAVRAQKLGLKNQPT